MDYSWKPCPEGQQLIAAMLAEILKRHSGLKTLRGAMLERTGSRLFDWIDHLIVPSAEGYQSQLEAAGFEKDAHDAFQHPGAIFPRVLVRDLEWGACVKVEKLEDFIAIHGSETPPTPFGSVRECLISTENHTRFTIIERHGSRELEPHFSAEFTKNFPNHYQQFRFRDRSAQDFTQLDQLVTAAITELGQHAAAAAFFKAERDYWMSRNTAARAQYARQQSLGLGWANHDHHTYRCRREDFAPMVRVFEQLGCHCRERFYAGKEAGWGAQVMENPEAGIVIFADVDMTPEEVLGDFSHEGLPRQHELGTVGLWCELHGNSLFEAGMHHLECQFDFATLAEGLEQDAGIRVMAPFSDLPELKQQFTEGERWSIQPARIQKLLQENRISTEQAEAFLLHGAIGSHLENLERNDGFKGFNQTGINEIIQATDPRRA